MSGLLGGNSDKMAKLQKQQAEAAQRRAMAEMARQQAEADQAKAAGGRKRGRSMLTFLGADGQATLG
jgi:hypothetical protein